MKDILVTPLEILQGRSDDLGISLLSRAGGIAQLVQVRVADELGTVGGVDLEDANGVAGGEGGEIGFFDGAETAWG